ncbi:MAG: acetone carboxylase subunit gamma [Gammaproteobacteria bacterium]|nr:acetone carboxylase subunit gamma [Gammaproteobacteria bacterium]
MRVVITEYLRIDLDAERWECRNCNAVLGPARENYKRGLLVYDRDPREIHAPQLDPARYAYTFAPDPAWCRILEYYCPCCGSLVEAEYTVPGHPPLHDIELDIDSLKRRAAEFVAEGALAKAPDLTVPDPRAAFGHAHRHDHDHEVQP